MQKLDNKTVLVLILNYRTPQMTIKLIDQIRNTVQYSDYDILVVDNKSPDDSAMILSEAAQRDGFLFIEENKNRGYAAGNNVGIRYAIVHGYKYTLIMNSDIEINDGIFLSHMVNIADHKADVGCVGPKIYSSNGKPVAPFCRRPTPFRNSIGLLNELRYRKKRINTSGYVYNVYGCCMLVKNDVMAKIDCMDEETFLYYEEAILSERMLSENSFAYYDAEVSVIHKESSSMKIDPARKRRTIKNITKSRELYMRKYRKYNGIERLACHLMENLMIMLRG